MREYFSLLIGNDKTKRRLGDAILKNTLPHAFLFVGAFGSGKKTLAGELAAALNCENKDNAEKSLPCHVCNNCRRIKERLFTDIHYVRREAKKMSVGVDEIHRMRADMALSATESDFRVYIIEEAEKLTPQAQNAMLTVLEEPPKNVIIILLAEEADKLLTTVKSRVQTVYMESFPADVILGYLRKHSDKARIMEKTEPDNLSGILMTSEGRIGQAQALIDDTKAEGNILERREITENFISALKQNTAFSELYSAAKELPTGRAELKETLEEILSALRDLTLLKYDPSAPLIFFASRDRAKEISDRMNTKRLFALYELVTQTLENNAKNVNVGAEISNLAAKIKLI